MDYTKGPWSELGIGHDGIEIMNFKQDTITPLKGNDWNLVKAAPNMYEALMALEKSGNILNLDNDIRAIVRKALAKAEGK